MPKYEKAWLRRSRSAPPQALPISLQGREVGVNTHRSVLLPQG